MNRVCASPTLLASSSLRPVQQDNKKSVKTLRLALTQVTQVIVSVVLATRDMVVT